MNAVPITNLVSQNEDEKCVHDKIVKEVQLEEEEEDEVSSSQRIQLIQITTNAPESQILSVDQAPFTSSKQDQAPNQLVDEVAVQVKEPIVETAE